MPTIYYRPAYVALLILVLIAGCSAAKVRGPTTDGVSIITGIPWSIPTGVRLSIHATDHTSTLTKQENLGRLIQNTPLIGRVDAAQPLELTRLDALLEQDRHLNGRARTANQKRILDLLNSLSPIALLLLRENSQDAFLIGWIELIQILQVDDPANRIPALHTWSQRHRQHPAEQRLIDYYLPAITENQPKHIALLLPMTSPFGEAARAFYQGFIHTHSADQSPNKPTLSLYDIGENSDLVPLYYHTAIKRGADFIVGPLGRNAVSALLADASPKHQTLLIGTVPPDKAASHLYAIGLSPEREAQQIAEQAFIQGHRRAAVLRSRSKWGARVATAFIQQWENLGGVINSNYAFSPDAADHSNVIRQLFSLDKSRTRAKKLHQKLNVELKYSLRRRTDLDFLFLAAKAKQARLLTPQLRFFHAKNLPLYATSHVYSGKPDRIKDTDLNGVIFADMNWMINAEKISSKEFSRNFYHHTQLDRLYALGLESYTLIPILQALRNNPRRRHFGTAVDISMNADGNAVQHLTWARFEDGIPVLLEPRVNFTNNRQ